MASIKARAVAGISQRGALRTGIKNIAFIYDVKLTLKEGWGLFGSRFRICFSGEEDSVQLAADALRAIVAILGGDTIDV